MHNNPRLALAVEQLATGCARAQHQYGHFKRLLKTFN